MLINVYARRTSQKTVFYAGCSKRYIILLEFEFYVAHYIRNTLYTKQNLSNKAYGRVAQW